MKKRTLAVLIITILLYAAVGVVVVPGKIEEYKKSQMITCKVLENPVIVSEEGGVTTYYVPLQLRDGKSGEAETIPMYVKSTELPVMATLKTTEYNYSLCLDIDVEGEALLTFEPVEAGASENPEG